MNTKGVVYGVSNIPWLTEAIVSAYSLKKVMPELPVELHIEKNTNDLIKDNVNLNNYFDNIILIDECKNWRTPKFSALNSKSFKQVLYLDSDTYITDRIDELFELLNKFEIAVMPAPQRIHRKFYELNLSEVFPYTPKSFPEYNAGVIIFNNTNIIQEFFKEWYKLYEKGYNSTSYKMDQGAFRATLYNSNLRLCALNPEYNLRAGVPNVVKDKVKIIHAHGRLREIASLVNKSVGVMRFLPPLNGLVDGFKPKSASNILSDEIIQNQISELKDVVSNLD